MLNRTISFLFVSLLVVPLFSAEVSYAEGVFQYLERLEVEDEPTTFASAVNDGDTFPSWKTTPEHYYLGAETTKRGEALYNKLSSLVSDPLRMEPGAIRYEGGPINLFRKVNYDPVSGECPTDSNDYDIIKAEAQLALEKMLEDYDLKKEFLPRFILQGNVNGIWIESRGGVGVIAAGASFIGIFDGALLLNNTRWMNLYADYSPCDQMMIEMRFSIKDFEKYDAAPFFTIKSLKNVVAQMKQNWKDGYIGSNQTGEATNKIKITHIIKGWEFISCGESVSHLIPVIHVWGEGGETETSMRGIYHLMSNETCLEDSGDTSDTGDSCDTGNSGDIVGDTGDTADSGNTADSGSTSSTSNGCAIILI